MFKVTHIWLIINKRKHPTTIHAAYSISNSIQLSISYMLHNVVTVATIIVTSLVGEVIHIIVQDL